MVKETSALGLPLVTVKLATPTFVTVLAGFPFPSKLPQVVSSLEPRPGSPVLSVIAQFPVEADAVAVAVTPAAVTVELGAVVLSQESHPATTMAAEADIEPAAKESASAVIVLFVVFILYEGL